MLRILRGCPAPLFLAMVALGIEMPGCADRVLTFPQVAQSPPHKGGHYYLIKGKAILPQLIPISLTGLHHTSLPAAGASQPVIKGPSSQQQLEASKKLQGEMQGWSEARSLAQVLSLSKGVW